jgi:N-acetyl-gamma-glutamyl-phosphate reductase
VTRRIFIDGQAGTTGLRIREWLAGRPDIALVEIDDAHRKDVAARRDAIAAAELVVLCLPDEATREAVAAAAGTRTRILDASSAHRTSEGWVFGLPELDAGQRAQIAAADRVSNTGCWSTAVILALRPLVDAGLVRRDAALGVHGVSGYSGGGKAMIARWEDPALGLGALPFEAPYALDRIHKHVPEMTRYAGLLQPPHFVPAVGPFRCGMRVEIPLHAGLRAPGADGKAVQEALEARYRGERFVRVLPLADPLASDERTFDPRACNDTNRIELRVIPNPAGHVLLVAVLDNLGKGAAGVAIQNLNLMLGLPEESGLRAD